MNDERKSAAEFFDATWEEQARQTLKSAGRDPERGVRAARDALRLVAGEISDGEFHARHHDSYLDEFGTDDRPLEQVAATSAVAEVDSSSGAAATTDPALPQRISRRAALRLAGAGAALLFAGSMVERSFAQTTAPSDGKSPGPRSGGAGGTKDAVRWGMVIDLENCTGCLACVDGCHEENGLADGVHWIYSLAFTDENQADTTPGQADPNFLVRPCMHCSNAPCVKVCPVAARHTREADGLVLTDYDICIGCRYCEVSCPYGVNYFQWGEPSTYGGGSYTDAPLDVRGRAVNGAPPIGVMGKCNFCPQRVDDPERRGTAACALACPHDAIFVGDLNDPESAPRRHLAKRQAENPDLSTFRLLDELGTEPNVIYIGQEPSERAVAVEGPTRYEDWGFIEDRRAVLEGPEPWFQRVVGRN